jgi:hypothetical protein
MALCSFLHGACMAPFFRYMARGIRFSWSWREEFILAGRNEFV